MDRSVGIGVVFALVGVVLAAPSSSAAPEAAPQHAPLAAPMAATSKKSPKGNLKVSVTGSGAYRVVGKGIRRSARTSKVFKVKAGWYTVKAPGGMVTPGKVRVKRGKTARVKVRFSTTGNPPPGDPTSPPSPSPSTPPGGPVQQWVQAGSAATVSTAGGYSISIPAGVLRESAVVSVTPLAAAAGGLPAADFHIAGAWAGNVQVTLPTADVSSDPVVLHEASDGLRVTSGNGAQPGTSEGVPTVTVSVTSLSPFYSAAVDCSSLSEVAQSLMCANQTDRKLADLLAAIGTQAAKPVQAGRATAAAVSSDCPNSSLGMPSSGDLAKGITCSESIDGSWGQWGFTNTNHASYLGGLYSAGAVYSMNVTGAFDRAVDRPDDIPFILWPLYEPMKNLYVFPNQKTKIRKTTGSGVSTVSTYPDPGVTPLWASTGFLIGLVGGELIDDLVKDPNLNLEAKIKACVPQGSMSLSATVVNCLKNTIIESLEYYAKHASLGKKAKVAATLAKVLAGGDVLMVGDSFWRAFKAQFDSGLENRLDLEKVEVNTGIDPPSHPKTINSYIARDPDTGRSVLVDRGRVTMINNGGLFNCLARTRAVWDIGNLKALKQTADGVQMSCYDEGSAWTYTPTAQGGNTGTKIILRDTSTTPHTNYLINSAGEIRPITSGGTYLCLAASNPVIWNTPTEKITAWTPASTPAACGGGASGDLVQVNTAADGTPSNFGTSGMSGYQFSPDGNSVAFNDFGSNLVPETTSQDFGRRHLYAKNLRSGSIQLINADGARSPGNESTELGMSWSPDGSKIAFGSYASNLISGDTNELEDVFVKTLASDAIQRISTNRDGEQATGGALWGRPNSNPSWSPDGTRIAFISSATNLVAGDTNGTADVYVKTLADGNIQRLSSSSAGAESNGSSHGELAWSPDGTRIAFTSDATNLVSGDTNAASDVFVKTLASGTIQRLSTGDGGRQGNASSTSPAWSPDGTRVAFSSDATNLVSGDTNDTTDVFIKTLFTGATTRVSTSITGVQADDYSYSPVWSGDSERVAFTSEASNLALGDTNGRPDVYMKTLRTGEIARLSTGRSGAELQFGAHMPALSPDGGAVLFEGGSFRELWMKSL